MSVRHEISYPTGQQMRAFRGICHGVLPSGLTAPMLRVFTVLLAHTDPAGNIDILKPSLEAMAGVRIDAGDRFVEPLRSTEIDVPSAPDSAGDLWFDSIEFVAGERKKLAGMFRAKLSPAALAIISDPKWSGGLPVNVGEFRRLSTIAGIILYLRCRMLIAEQPNARETTIRWRDTDVFAAFGQYCSAARSRKKLASGEIGESIGLSRLTRVLLEPGIADIQRNVDDLLIGIDVVKAAGAGRGTAWKHIDIVFGPRPKRSSLRDLHEQTAARAEYERTKHAQLDDPADR